MANFDKMYERKDYDPSIPEEDNEDVFNTDDALLKVDRTTNRLINRYPTYKKKQIAMPLRDTKGKIVRDEHGRPIIDSIQTRLVFDKYKEESFKLPGLVDPNVPKSQLKPSDYPFIMTCEKLVDSMYMFQFREGVPMTNAILFFTTMLKKFIHYKRAYAGYGGRLSKSSVHYYYAGGDEASQYAELDKRSKPDIEVTAQEARIGKKKGRSPSRRDVDYLGTRDVDFGKLEL